MVCANNDAIVPVHSALTEEMGSMVENMQALNYTVLQIQTDIKVAYKPVAISQTPCPTCGNYFAAPTPIADPTSQSNLRSSTSQSSLRSTSTSSSTYEDALTDTCTICSSKDEGEHDSDSDGLSSLGLRKLEERPHAMPPNWPILNLQLWLLKRTLKRSMITAVLELRLQ